MKELFVMNASCNFKAASERIIVIAGTQTVTLDITTNYNNNNYTTMYYSMLQNETNLSISTASLQSKVRNLVFSVRCRILQIVRYSIVQAGARFCNMNIF